MPRLQLEPYLLSDAIFQRPLAESDPGTSWWVMHTKPRAEKALARRMEELRRGYFLPLYPQKSLKRNRIAVSYLPLFPSYLFVHGNEDDKLQALKTNYVVQCLPVKDQFRLHEDLHNVYRLMQAGEDISPESHLEPGDLVEIKHGSLSGMQGRIIRRENRMRFLVEVRLLQRGVSIEVESWMITSAD